MNWLIKAKAALGAAKEFSGTAAEAIGWVREKMANEADSVLE